jgi:hypothetical protein
VGVGEAVFQQLVGHLEVRNFRDVSLPLVAKFCREMPVLVQSTVQRLDLCIVFVPKTLCGLPLVVHPRRILGSLILETAEISSKVTVGKASVLLDRMKGEFFKALSDELQFVL